MIHTISRYYNTSKILTILFMKITNQIIINCKFWILKGKSYDEIWDFNPKELIEVFNVCIVVT